MPGLVVQPGDIADTCSETWLTLLGRVAPPSYALRIADLATSLDIRPHFSYKQHRISLSEGRLRPRVLPKAERVRCPRAEGYGPLPGSFGHHALRHYGRCGRCIPGLGQAGAGNARLAARSLSPPGWGELEKTMRSCRVPRKPGLELRPRGESPDGESRGGTPTGERATITRAPHPLMRNIETNAPAGVPLPFLLLDRERTGEKRNSE